MAFSFEVNKNLSILLLEDVVADAVLITHELEKGGVRATPKRVETREEFLRELEHKPDVILSDHGLPTFDGFTALREVKRRCPDIPFIFVAQAAGPEEVIRSYKSGACAFILKSQISTQLVPAIRDALAKAGERTQPSEPNVAQFRTLVASTPDYGIFVIDSDGKILSWNLGAKNITGLSEQDALGRDFSTWFSPDDLPAGKPQRLIKAALETGHAFEEWVRLQTGGKTFWAHLSATALRDGASPHPLVSVIVRDVTGLREAQQELERLREQAEQRCRQRTAELDAAIKELDAFSYSVSHDLRAPLRHIDGFVEMLHQKLQASLDNTSKEYLQIITTAAKQMGTLIDALLSFSRISRAPLFKSQVALDKVVQSVVRDLHFEGEGREVEWAISPLPVVVGDPTLLRQVFFNLMANALKFTRRRKNTRIELGATEHESEWLFHVRDNGVGFDMQYGNKLFGVFQRLHAATEFEGTGIGLANVRRIVQRHGGRTWAEGVPDSGATFYFSLPRSIPEAA